MKNILLVILISFCVFACKNDNGSQDSTKVSEQTSAPAEPKGPVKSVSLKVSWTSDSTSLVTPESVFFDEENGLYYVSCIGGVPPTKKDGDGYIARLDQRGKTLSDKWIIGLNAPKGMAKKDGKLFVTDIDELVIIDIASESIVERIKVPGSSFLNDVALAPSGDIYFTDSNENTVFQYKEGKVSLFKKDQGLGGTNGIYVDDETIYLAGFGNGDFNTIDLGSKGITNRGKGIIPGGDGVVPWEGGYMVSNWNGEIYYLDAQWNATKVLDTKADKVNAADIEINPKTKEVLVPTFFDNKVVAYRIENVY